jgi:Flp pilus assembly protein TadD
VHNGRVVKRTGDGSIVEFRSVVDAVRCVIEVQNGMIERNAGLPPDRRIEFRVGIHLGDVVEESDGDLMGDGVNIAARLEGMAKPGAICLSEAAYRQVSGRLDMEVTDLGPTQLKNIERSIRAYSLEVGKPAQAKPAKATAPSRRSLAALLAAGVVALIVRRNGREARTNHQDRRAARSRNRDRSDECPSTRRSGTHLPRHQPDQESREAAQSAVRLNPNYASAYAQLAMDEITPAELPLAIANLDQAIKVSPRDPEMDRWRWIKGMTFNYMSRYQDAIREIQSALDLGYSSWAVYTHLAVAYAFLGQQSETEAAVAQASHTKLEADH